MVRLNVQYRINWGMKTDNQLQNQVYRQVRLLTPEIIYDLIYRNVGRKLYNQVQGQITIPMWGKVMDHMGNKIEVQVGRRVKMHVSNRCYEH